jgi:hypothetical protein
MEATYSSETSVDFQRTTWLCVPEDRTVDKYRCENFKFYAVSNFMKIRSAILEWFHADLGRDDGGNEAKGAPQSRERA